MCSCQEYDHKIDVWSVGCIMAELLGRKPLFPGDDYIKQMNLIFGVLGTPTKSDMKFISNEKAREYIKSLKKRPKLPFNKIYKNANPLCLDLLEKMLVFNPHERITVEEALQHPYLKQLHNPQTEYACVEPFNFDFEKIDMTKSVLREFMWEEIYFFRPHLRKINAARKKKKERERKERKANGAREGAPADPSAPAGSTSAPAATSAPAPAASAPAPQ
jgi:mitogen-activated protein kinase 1/3